MARYYTNYNRDRVGLRDFTGTSDDPFFWCQPCADDEHQEHVGVFVDVFGCEHACCCARHDG